MSRSIKFALAAALLGSFAAGSAFAQEATVNIGCKDYMTLSPEMQLKGVEDYLKAAKGMEGTSETNDEIVSMLLAKCNDTPEAQAITLLNDMDIEVTN
jgi:hypothetical protein